MEKIYIQIINSMLEHVSKKGNNIVFVKSCTDAGFVECELEQLIENEHTQLLFYQYRRNFIQPAYDPFMEWIRSIYIKHYKKDMDEETFVKNCGIYVVQEEIFVSYLKHGICSRREDVLVHECVYEEKRFIQSIWNIIEFISKDMYLFFVLDRFHLANSSIMALLLNLIEKRKITNMALLLCFNETYEIENCIRGDWNNLMELSEKNNYIVDCGMIQRIEDNYSSDMSFEFNNDNAAMCYVTVNNLVYMLSRKQAEYYLSRMYQMIVFDKVYIEPSLKRKIIALYIYNNICLENVKYALLLCDELKEAYNDGDLYTQYAFNYLSCIAQSILYQKEDAKKHSLECYAIAQKIGDEMLIFKAKVIDYMYKIDFGRSSGITLIDEKTSREIVQFTKELIKYEFKNYLINVYIGYYERDMETLCAVNDNGGTLVYFNKAIELAKKIDNQAFLERAYDRKNHTVNLANCVALEDQLRRESIELQMATKKELSLSTYASMGYYYTSREQYVDSHKSNNKLLIGMYELHTKSNAASGIDNEVLEFLRVIYNMATNCMCVMDYESACDYLLVLIREMEAMNVFNIYVCDMAKVYGMIAYCFYMRNMEYNCTLYLEKQKPLVESALIKDIKGMARGDALFLYCIVKGLIKKNEKDYEAADILFKRAHRWFLTETGQHFILEPIFALAKYELYYDSGRKKKAQDELISSIEFCEKNNLEIKKDYLLKVLHTGVIDKNVPRSDSFELTGISMSQITELLRYKRIENELIEKSKDADFLLLWQENLNAAENSSDGMINNAMSLMKKYFNMDSMFYIDMLNDIVQFEDGDISLNKREIEEIKIFFESKRSAFIIKRIDKGYMMYEKLLDIFDAMQIVTLICVPVIRNSIIEKVFIAFTTIKDNMIDNSAIIKDYRLDTIKLAVNQLINAERIAIAMKMSNAANEAKSAFLANVSHEIRTPINAILGIDEMIIRESEEREIVEYGHNIKSAGKTLLSIINDILDYSKIESGRMELVCDNYSLASMVNDVVNMIMNKAESKKLEFIIDVDNKIPSMLYGDEVRIKQIMINALTNAVKYTKHGYVKLKVSSLQKNDKEMNLIIAVEDSGIGIKKEDIENLFVSFKRLELEKNRNIEGTGLGLSIVKQLVDLMDGRIRVESEYGKGTTFSFALPQIIVDFKPVGDCSRLYEERKEKYSESFIAKDARILAVDDSEINLKVILGLLKRTQISIDTAISGEQCLDKVKNTRYDLILMDHMMPGMDGIETLKRIRTQENMCMDVPVIAFTANAMSDAKHVYLDAGFVNYLTKPVNSEKLEKVLKEYIPSEKISIVIHEDEKGTEFEYDIEYVDTSLGMRYCNEDKDTYIEVLRTFYMSGAEHIDKISKEYENNDYTNYVIEVHALKSAALEVGAIKLSDIAANLENLVKKKMDSISKFSQDVDDNVVNQITSIIKENHLRMIQMYTEVLSSVGDFIKNIDSINNREIVNISKDELVRMLAKMKVYAERFMMIYVEEIIEDLQFVRCEDFDPIEFKLLTKQYIKDYEIDLLDQAILQQVKAII